MRELVLIGTLLGAAACGGTPAGGRDVAPAVPVADETNVDLAVLRTVGDAPPKERTVRIEVDAGAALAVDGNAVDLAGLRAALSERAGDGSSAEPTDIDALLVLDRSLPWKAAQVVLQECARVRIGRTFFAARHGNGSTGAFAAFLPVDAPVMRRRHGEVPKVVVRVRGTGAASDPLGLASFRMATYTRERTAPEPPTPVVEIDASASATVGFVLELADAAAQLGASRLLFVGTPVAGGQLDLTEVVAQARSRPPAQHVTVFGQPLPPYSGEALNIPRVEGAYAGFAVSPSLDVQPAEKPLEEPIEPR